METHRPRRDSSDHPWPPPPHACGGRGRAIPRVDGCLQLTSAAVAGGVGAMAVVRVDDSRGGGGNGSMSPRGRWREGLLGDTAAAWAADCDRPPARVGGRKGIGAVEGPKVELG